MCCKWCKQCITIKKLEVGNLFSENPIVATDNFEPCELLYMYEFCMIQEGRATKIACQAVSRKQKPYRVKTLEGFRLTQRGMGQENVLLCELNSFPRPPRSEIV